MKVRYDGPPGAINRDVGQETGRGDALNPGDEFEVSDALGRRLLASSVHFNEVAKAVKK